MNDKSITFRQAKETFTGQNSTQDLHSIRNAYHGFLSPLELQSKPLPDDFYQEQENMYQALDQSSNLDTEQRIQLFHQAHNVIQQYQPEILNRLQTIDTQLAKQAQKRFDGLNATIHRAYDEKNAGKVHEEIHDLYQHLHEQGFHQPHIHPAHFESPVSQHIESMWHNSLRQANKTSKNLEFYVETLLDQTPRDKHLIFSVYDTAGGFEDLNEEVAWTPPESTTGGGIGLTHAYNDVQEHNGEFLRFNTKHGASIHLAYPIRQIGGVLRQQ